MRDELPPTLLLRAQKGDAKACRALVQTYQQPVFSMLSRMISHPLVEDSAQEVFLKVFRALPNFRFDGPALLSTWILTIAVRTALDINKKAQLRLVPLEEEWQLPSMQSADDGVQQHQAEQDVEAALATLPGGQRAVLVLTVFDGCSQKEIAAMLQIDVGTVKSRLSRARAALREKLQEGRHVG